MASSAHTDCTRCSRDDDNPSPKMPCARNSTAPAPPCTGSLNACVTSKARPSSTSVGAVICTMPVSASSCPACGSATTAPRPDAGRPCRQHHRAVWTLLPARSGITRIHARLRSCCNPVHKPRRWPPCYGNLEEPHHGVSRGRRSRGTPNESRYFNRLRDCCVGASLPQGAPRRFFEVPLCGPPKLIYTGFLVGSE